MNKTHLLIITVLLFAFSVNAQTFTEITDQNFMNVNSEGVVWFDFDNDNDLDLFMTGGVLFAGMSGESNRGLYENTGNGKFLLTTTINDAFPFPFDHSDVTVGDYNNDGFLDIFASGYCGADNSPYVRNHLIKNNGDGSFSEITTNITPIWLNASSKFIDTDNDGDHDLFISGSDGSGTKYTKIYLNNELTFKDANIIITPTFGSKTNMADYDNDGDNDAFISGWDGISTYQANIWENEGESNFTDTEIPFIGVAGGGILPFDFNCDGNIDVLIKGLKKDPYEPYCAIYLNNGNKTYTITTNEITPMWTREATTGDYNNDGYLDLFVSGQTSYSEWGNWAVKYYSNNQDETFTEIPDLDIFDMGGVVKPADYDNDGDLDFIFNGTHTTDLDVYTAYTKFYKNNIETPNNIPTAPTNLQMTLSNGELTLSWDAATDAETPQAGLTYNIFVGTSEDGINIVSPLADIETGYRRVVDFGNVGHNTSWSIKNVTAENIYWGVQAVDNCYAGSEFATNNNVTTINNKTDNQINIYPNPSNGTFTITNYELQIMNIKITDITGKTILNSQFSTLNSQFSIQKKGIYFINIKTDNQIFTQKLIIQ